MLLFTALLTLLACTSTPCEDALGAHADGDSWTCDDGCNTCACDNGAISSTEMACASCVDATGTYAPGDTWTCEDGCNTCGCQEDGTIESTDLGCLAPCADASGTYTSGESWACPDGCNTCLCDDGDIVSTDLVCD